MLYKSTVSTVSLIGNNHAKKRSFSASVSCQTNMNSHFPRENLKERCAHRQRVPTLAPYPGRARSRFCSAQIGFHVGGHLYRRLRHVMVVARMDSRYDEIVRVLMEVIVPLVGAEGGQVYLVSADANRVSVHLAGHLSGAPGNALFCRRVLEPAIRTVAPDAEVFLSSGCRNSERSGAHGPIRVRRGG